jgi:hypothetical protein
MLGGLLAVTGSWSVHLGASSPAISPASVVSDFEDPFYPEYVVAIWNPLPFVVDLQHVVHATGASVSFAAPSLMPQVLYCAWVTYTDYQGNVQLLEAWYLDGAPIPFGPGGAGITINLGFKDFSF